MADLRASEKPHFMQPILPGFDKSFLIPIDFFKYLKGGKCEGALLRSSHGGELWPVKMSGRRITDGWVEYAKRHELHVGDFVVFRHEGDMVFDVTVFDPSTCEKEYGDQIDADQMEDREKHKEERAMKGGSNGNEVRKEKHTCSSASRGNTSSYVGVMRPSYEAILFLPLWFSKANGLGKECSEMVLRDESGKLWHMKVGHSNRQRAYANWRDFKEANGVTVGQMFKLKIIKRGRKPVLQFQKLGTDLSRKVIIPMPEPKASNQFATTAIPRHFYGTIRPSNMDKWRILIPRAFSIENGLADKHGEMILKNSAGEPWAVMLRCQGDNQPYIGSGWRIFALENGVKVGDKYMLELTTGTKELIMQYNCCNSGCKGAG